MTKNLLKKDVQFLQSLEELKGKKVAEVVDYSVGMNANFFIITEDREILHMKVVNDYGDYSFEPIMSDKFIYEIYEKGYTYEQNILESHDLINQNAINHYKDLLKLKNEKEKLKKEEEEFKLYLKLKQKYEKKVQGDQ